jgi:hypothetical protein
MVFITYMPNTTTSQSMALLAPFLNASVALPGISLLSQDYTYGDINDAQFQTDDSVESSIALGSRLIPATAYRDSPARLGQIYEELLDSGTTSYGRPYSPPTLPANNPTFRISTHLIAGGQSLSSSRFFQH